MIVSASILAVIYKFLDNHKEDIASKIIASASYDMLKKGLDFKALKQRFGNLFKNDEQADQFVQELCEKKVDDATSPDSAVKEIFERITGENFQYEVLEAVKEWLTANSEQIKQLNTITISNSTGFNIGVQNAQGGIFNIQGDYNVDSQKDGH